MNTTSAPAESFASEVEALTALAAAVLETGYAFTTVTPRSHAIVNERPGNAEARSLRDIFGWSRPFHAELLPAHIFEMLSALDLMEEVGGRYKSLVRFSSLRGRLFMHSAFPTEAVDSIFFGPGTYMFVDAVVDSLARRRAPVRRAVDICSGAGPGAVVVADLARDAEVTMVDINPTALRYGAANAALADHRDMKVCLGDKLANVDGDFDLIITHPPYLVDSTSRAYRHGGGHLGADLSIDIVRAALDRLAPLGTLVVFTGIAIVEGEDAFKETVGRLATQAGCDWTYREVDPDVFGEELSTPAYAEVDRIAHVVFEAIRRAAAA